MNFSGIYEEEDFYKNTPYEWIDFRNMSGCNCYCDEDAKREILEVIHKIPDSKIHFIDSGNYHYVSRLWLEKINIPFRLLVFDNHTDMQPPAFGGILSCGGWIAAALEELPFLQEVILVGPDEEAFEQVEMEWKKKVSFLSREKLMKMTNEERQIFMEKISMDLPLYISIDKDVLCQEDADTTWSQGDMKLTEMLGYLRIIAEKFQENGQEIIGIDICGECDLDKMEECEKNNFANKTLLELLKNKRYL